jgi:hypothetical protein
MLLISEDKQPLQHSAFFVGLEAMRFLLPSATPLFCLSFGFRDRKASIIFHTQLKNSIGSSSVILDDLGLTLISDSCM